MSEAREVRVWFLRLGDRLKLAGSLGGVVTLVLGTAFFGGWALGESIYRSQVGLTELGVRFGLFFSLGAGYLVFATRSAVRGGRRELGALRPVLRCSDGEYDSLARSLVRHDRRGLLLAGLAGLFISLAVAEGFGLSITRLTAQGPAFPAVLGLGLTTVFFVIGGQTIVIAMTNARLLRDIAEVAEVNVFDLRMLEPFSRYGARLALLVFGLVAIHALFFMHWTLPTVIAVQLIAVAPLATIVLLIPGRGIRERIQAEKRRLFDALWDETGGAQGLVAPEALASSEATQRTRDLLALRDRIDGASEWPVGAGGWLRFGLGLLLPLAGWWASGAVDALVELALAQ